MMSAAIPMQVYGGVYLSSFYRKERSRMRRLVLAIGYEHSEHETVPLY